MKRDLQGFEIIMNIYGEFCYNLYTYFNIKIQKYEFFTGICRDINGFYEIYHVHARSNILYVAKKIWRTEWNEAVDILPFKNNNTVLFSRSKHMEIDFKRWYNLIISFWLDGFTLFVFCCSRYRIGESKDLWVHPTPQSSSAASIYVLMSLFGIYLLFKY